MFSRRPVHQWPQRIRLFWSVLHKSLRIWWCWMSSSISIEGFVWTWDWNLNQFWSHFVISYFKKTDTVHLVIVINNSQLRFVRCSLFAMAGSTWTKLDASILFDVHHFLLSNGISSNSLHSHNGIIPKKGAQQLINYIIFWFFYWVFIRF